MKACGETRGPANYKVLVNRTIFMNVILDEQMGLSEQKGLGTKVNDCFV